jgi:hypothetical protein
MNYSYGDIYEGEWLENEIRGKGVLSFKNGTRLQGLIFNGGKFVEGKYFIDNEIYEGILIDRILEGYG